MQQCVAFVTGNQGVSIHMERRLRGVAATRSQGRNPRQSYQMAIFEVSSVGGGRTARAPPRP
ncbi:hypothetical protein ACX84Q_24545, partial [Burkholderia pseudomallei]